MSSLAVRLMKSFVVLVMTVGIVTATFAAIAPPMLGNHEGLEPYNEAKPSDDPPVCAKEGTPARLWPIGSKPYGRTYNEWSQDWWRWTLSLPPAINPILDTNGDACSYGQHGPVWFLAGNFGGATVRTCSVACNKAIFLPIINCEWENGWVGQPILTVPELRAICAGAGSPLTATLEVDGRPLNVAGNRVASDIFDYAMGPDNLGGQPQGVYFPTISDGIWAMLDPLPPGPHTVRFTASGSDGFSLDVTYLLDVVPLELPCSSPSCR